MGGWRQLFSARHGLKRFLLSSIVVLAALFPAVAHATPDFAEATGQECAVCHHMEKEVELNELGFAYQYSGYVWPPEIGAESVIPMDKYVRSVIGYLHLLAGFMWFGTIIYVHIILRPAYAAKGLPPSEVRLGKTTMILAGASGILLLLSKVSGAHVLYTTKWGILLSVKVILFLVMVGSAAFVITYLGPRLKTPIKDASHPKGGVFDPETLSAFDGKEGRPAYVAFACKVYDLTGLSMWKGGAHFRHLAGEDLTGAMARAPHGAEKLTGQKVMGTFDEQAKAPMTRHQRLFYFFAYMNLALVFVILLVVAFWRWGI